MLQSMRSAAKPIFIILAITFVGGFLFADASGLLGRAPVTAGTPIATVNGRNITYSAWASATENARQQQEQQLGRALTADERAQLDQQVYDRMVESILLEQEYARRGIVVSDDEIREAARSSAPEDIMRAATFQTEGRFDPEKYQRYMASSAGQQSGLRLYVENYFRERIPQEKLSDQVASDVYVTDARLWSFWQDQHDSAQVTFAAFRPALVADSAVTVTDAEARDWFDKHKDDFANRGGRARVSLVAIPRTITAADSAATRARVVALRNEILGGAKFEDVATRESSDSGSAANGGSLGRAPLGQYVTAFADAARALKPGELSQPVLSPFGYHLIRVDDRKGDTATVHHILLRIQQSDSSATRTDREADELARLAAGQQNGAKFDSAARRLNLPVEHAVVLEGQPLRVGMRAIPDASAFVFGGARVGETSDLLSDDDAYYLVRIDSLQQGGANYDELKADIRQVLLERKKVEKLVPRAQQLAAAAATSPLEGAAQAQGVTLQTSGLFSRVSAVPGLGQLNEAIGAAFALPVGAVSAPVKTRDGVFVLRVDRRLNSDRAAFEAQKAQLRAQITDGMRRQRVDEFIQNLRQSARITDHRKEVFARGRGQTDES